MNPFQISLKITAVVLVFTITGCGNKDTDSRSSATQSAGSAESPKGGASLVGSNQSVQGAVTAHSPTAEGQGITGAKVAISDQTGIRLNLTTDSLGKYQYTYRFPSTYQYQVTKTRNVTKRAYVCSYGRDAITGQYTNSCHWERQRVTETYTETETAENVLNIQVSADNYYPLSKQMAVGQYGSVASINYSLEIVTDSSIPVPQCKVNDNLYASNANGCQDLTSGLTWFLADTSKMNYEAAKTVCTATPNGRLPTIKEINKITRGNGWKTHLNFNVGAGFWSKTYQSASKVWVGRLDYAYPVAVGGRNIKAFTACVIPVP